MTDNRESEKRSWQMQVWVSVSGGGRGGEGGVCLAGREGSGVGGGYGG